MMLFVFLCGFGLGAAVSAVHLAWLMRRKPRELPPATTKQIARAARANRAELRVLQGGDSRHWISPANGDFDDGDTQ